MYHPTDPKSEQYVPLWARPHIKLLQHMIDIVRSMGCTLAFQPTRQVMSGNELKRYRTTWGCYDRRIQYIIVNLKVMRTPIPISPRSIHSRIDPDVQRVLPYSQAATPIQLAVATCCHELGHCQQLEDYGYLALELRLLGKDYELDAWERGYCIYLEYFAHKILISKNVFFVKE